MSFFPYGAADDLVCLSHLRWGFVFQRPQHLMTRFARHRRVFFIEEPIFDATRACLTSVFSENVHVVTPHLPAALATDTRFQARLIKDFLQERGVQRPVLWFYTPQALPLVAGLEVSAVVYDCMDELSGFANAPRGLKQAERALMAATDVMFTGGRSLYLAKRGMHPNVHAVPSSVDVGHFQKARTIKEDPEDQARLPRPRLGFCGVIDERMNLDLVRAVATRRPDWHFVMLGPVVKIDPNSLPRLHNIHYLGQKAYAELPAYFAGWDVALMPFAHNSATKFISPTKTPEYLAAGCPVVSTSIRDVVEPYGEAGCVEIADTPDAWCDAIERSLTSAGRAAVERAEPLLAQMSWDRTFDRMNSLLDQAMRSRDAKDSTHPAPEASIAAPLMSQRL